MFHNYEKQTILNEKLVVEYGNLSVKFTYTHHSGNIYVSFGTKSEWESLLLTEEPINAYKKVKRYDIYSDEAINCLQLKGYSRDFQENFEMKHSSDYVNWKELENNMVHFYGSGHLFFDLSNELLPIAHYQSYIGGVCNDEFDLDKVVEIAETLSKAGVILSYKHVNIPYYNADKKRNQSIEFTWIVDKETYNKFYNELKLTDKYPSVRLKELWKSHNWFQDALIKKKK